MEQCGPPDWNSFIEWLWEKIGPQLNITKGKVKTRIGLVSHGNFLGQLFKDNGYITAHPDNTQAFAAVLTFKTSASGVPYGFDKLTITGEVFKGFHSPSVKLY